MKSSTLTTLAYLSLIFGALFTVVNLLFAANYGGGINIYPGVIGFFAFVALLAISSILNHIEKMHEIMKRDYLKRYPEEDKTKQPEAVASDKA